MAKNKSVTGIFSPLWRYGPLLITGFLGSPCTGSEIWRLAIAAVEIYQKNQGILHGPTKPQPDDFYKTASFCVFWCFCSGILRFHEKISENYKKKLKCFLLAASNVGGVNPP